MPGPSKIEAYAIVSADGMLADANRRIPPALVVEADQKFFHGGLDQAAAVAHGVASELVEPQAGVVASDLLPGLRRALSGHGLQRPPLA